MRVTGIRGTHSCSVLRVAFCDIELSSVFATSLGSHTQPGSFRQDAETSRLEACAPRILPFTR